MHKLNSKRIILLCGTFVLRYRDTQVISKKIDSVSLGCEISFRVKSVLVVKL